LPKKLILKTKRDKNNKILKQKAKWVIKRFRQQYGKDFNQTFVEIYKNIT